MYLMLFTYVRIARVKEWDFNNMENKANLVLCSMIQLVKTCNIQYTLFSYYSSRECWEMQSFGLSLIIWTISVTYLCNVVLNHLCAEWRCILLYMLLSKWLDLYRLSSCFSHFSCTFICTKFEVLYWLNFYSALDLVEFSSSGGSWMDTTLSHDFKEDVRLPSKIKIDCGRKQG